ncbi:MAG: hypothetical protein ACO3NK_12235 [Prochlorotrichaceae cyanobacterium]
MESQLLISYQQGCGAERRTLVRSVDRPKPLLSSAKFSVKHNHIEIAMAATTDHKIDVLTDQVGRLTESIQLLQS